MNVPRERKRFEVRASDAAELDRAIAALCREVRERDGVVLALNWVGTNRCERTEARVLCQLPLGKPPLDPGPGGELGDVLQD